MAEIVITALLFVYSLFRAVLRAEELGAAIFTSDVLFGNEALNGGLATEFHGGFGEGVVEKVLPDIITTHFGGVFA